MVLPIPIPRLSANQLYPDRITINFQYAIYSESGAPSFQHALRIAGFRATQNRRNMQGAITAEGNEFNVLITRPTPSAPTSFYVTINPLSFLHVQRVDYGVERTRDGSAINWLHPAEVRRDNRGVAVVTDRLTRSINDEIHALVQRISEARRAQTPPQLIGISITSVEVTVDLASADPGALVERLRPRFNQLFRNVDRSRYPTTAESYDHLRANSHMISGFRTRYERYKLYDKTNQRVRLECQLTNRALTSARIQRNLIDADYDFSAAFARCATHVVPHFNALLQNLLPGRQMGRAPFELIAAIGSRIQSENRLLDLLQTFARNSMIAPPFERGAIRRLHDCGVLERSSRGIYTAAAQYRSALIALQQMDATWQSGIQAGGNHAAP